ncbi:MAG: peptidyl-prolyl cis-trans isomerase [Pseudomonadota bacterium]
MRKRLTICLIALLAICSCKGKAETVLATVQGQSITATDLTWKMRMEQGLYDPVLLRDKENFEVFRRNALESLIQESVLLNKAQELGITVSENPASSKYGNTTTEQGIDSERWNQTQYRRAIIGKLIEKEVLAKVPISEEQIAKYYREHIGDFRHNTRFHARQILVDKMKTADSIRVKLMQGAEFAALARQFSISPDAERGGDLGYFDADSYPEVFSQICQQLKPGEISEVIATPYGYQIFQLIAKVPPRQRSVEEVKETIKRRLQEDKVDEVYMPWLNTIMKQARVLIHEDALKEVTFDEKG